MDNYKPVKGYENTHIVYDDGRVFKICKNGSKTELKPKVCRKNATPIIHLITNGVKLQCSLSKIVAEAFIPNPNNCKWILHKDGNNSNNCVDNLEWTNTKPGRSEKVICSNGKIYNSILDAGTACNLTTSQVRVCLLTGRQENGLTFKYAEKDYVPKEEKVPNLLNEEWKPLRETMGQYMISNMGRVKTIKRQKGSNLTQERLVVAGITEKRATIKTRTYLEDGTVKRRFFTVINEVMRHFGDIDPDTSKLYNKDGDVNNCALSNIGVR